MQSNGHNEAWWEDIVQGLRDEAVVPVISRRVINKCLPGYDTFTTQWATDIEYPFPLSLTVPKIAQYLAVMHNARGAKDRYLRFSKEYLLAQMKAGYPEAHPFLDLLEQESADLTFSQTLNKLAHPGFATLEEHPLRILAEFKLPLYIMTSYHTVMEQMLVEAGVNPHPTICYWEKGLKHKTPSVFEENDEYEPTSDEPLVFHLFGIDSNSRSMIVIEDEHLEFLQGIAERKVAAIHQAITSTYKHKSLLLIGFDLMSWEFRLMFASLIKPYLHDLEPMNLSIQLAHIQDDPLKPQEQEQYIAYFERYLGTKFNVYWGTPYQFCETLFERWSR